MTKRLPPRPPTPISSLERTARREEKRFQARAEVLRGPFTRRGKPRQRLGPPPRPADFSTAGALAAGREHRQRVKALAVEISERFGVEVYPRDDGPWIVPDGHALRDVTDADLGQWQQLGAVARPLIRYLRILSPA